MQLGLYHHPSGILNPLNAIINLLQSFNGFVTENLIAAVANDS
jgi:hypothetical protein